MIVKKNLTKIINRNYVEFFSGIKTGIRLINNEEGIKPQIKKVVIKFKFRLLLINANIIISNFKGFSGNKTQHITTTH